MCAQLAYGGMFLLLRTAAVDLCCFSWHGLRPVGWQRQLVKHRLYAPHGGEIVPLGTDRERKALKKAQALFPDRYMYLGVGARFSPWYCCHWSHYVKVLVIDGQGTPPENKYGWGDCWGMEWDDFLQTEWVKKQCQQ